MNKVTADKKSPRVGIQRIAIIASLPKSLVIFRGPLIKSLCDQGIEVHVVAPELKSDTATCSVLHAWGVTTHNVSMQRTGTNPLGDLVGLISLYRRFRAIKPDAVLGYTIKPVIYGTLAAWLAGVRYRFALVTGLGYAFTGTISGHRALINAIVQRLYVQALKRAQKVFFQNPDDEALFRELRILTSSTPSLVVNGSGVDLEQFSVTKLPEGPPVFLLIARLLGDKGVREYVAAAEKVKQRFPDVLFRLVGPIDSNPDSISDAELQSWISAGYVEYLGGLDDVRPAITSASVYVLPSYREGTPRTVLEAMAMGRPVITTDAPGCRETVVHEQNGYLVPVKAVSELAEAMEQFIVNPGLIEEMSKASRLIAEEKYDVHKVNQVMLKAMGLAQ